MNNILQLSVANICNVFFNCDMKRCTDGHKLILICITYFSKGLTRKRVTRSMTGSLPLPRARYVASDSSSEQPTRSQSRIQPKVKHKPNYDTKYFKLGIYHIYYDSIKQLLSRGLRVAAIELLYVLLLSVLFCLFLVKYSCRQSILISGTRLKLFSVSQIDNTL